MMILGVMSGSSLDGLDLAVVDIDQDLHKLMDKASIPLPAALIARLRGYEDCSAKEMLLLERDYTEFVGKAINSFIDGRKIDLIGFHGHTTIHVPDENLTQQLGNGGRLSAITRIPVVSDFRIQDIVKGGVGTPLVSIYDLHLLKDYDYCLNLGGIANITSISSIKAYDISPCNQLLNYISKKKFDVDYDHDGQRARQGQLIPDLFSKIDEYNYWAEEAPKSLDNNWIKERILTPLTLSYKGEDLLYSATDWIAEKINNELLPSDKEQQIFLSGGGTLNTFLVEMLQKKGIAKNARYIVPTEDDINYKESILMAYLAYLRVHKQTNVLASITGASSDSCAGAVYEP